MSEMKWAIITGADGGMGTEITRAVAKAGYRIIMACYHPKKAEVVRERLSKETGNPDLEVMAIDLSSMQSVVAFASQILERNLPISLLMNNAGTMETGLHITVDGDRFSYYFRRIRTNGKCELHGTLSAYPEINSADGAWSAYRKYGFLYIRNRQARLPGFLS